jgi:hypothetical protein
MGKKLLRAAGDGNIETVRRLLDKGEDVNATDKIVRSTPLHRAAEQGRTEVVALLLDRGAEVNARASYSMTPLHIAAARGQVEVAALLLDRGADPNAKDDGGETPGQLAIENGHDALTKLLTSRGSALPVETLAQTAQGMMPQGMPIVDVRSDETKRIEGDAIAGVSLGAELDGLVDELIAIGSGVGFLAMEEGDGFNSSKRNIRAVEIGEKLNDMGGMELMKQVWYRVHLDKQGVPRRNADGSTIAGQLEIAWSGIGEWQA